MVERLPTLAYFNTSQVTIGQALALKTKALTTKDRLTRQAVFKL